VLVSGASVQTPYDVTGLPEGHRVVHGVELDQRGRHAAYWIRQADGMTSKRQPAHGARSGRRLAWLLYGTDNAMEETRGTPLLGLVLQSLKEVDRYRDSVQRKAVVNSMLAMFIKKGQDKIGSLPVQNSAVRHDQIETTSSDGSARSFDVSGQIPGIVMQELQHGEEPVGFHSQGTDLDFGRFEATIINAIAWAHEMPPEILTLAFSSNYSASQAAINEFKIYLNRVRTAMGAGFCQPIYQEWLVSEVLNGRIDAPGLIRAWRDPSRYDELGAWMFADWSGAIKPSTDVLKQAKGHKILVDNGWMTNARSSRELTGTKYRRNMSILKRENELKADVMRPVLELRREFGSDETADVESIISDAIEAALTEARDDG